jgi:hypothetical protein
LKERYLLTRALAYLWLGLMFLSNAEERRTARRDLDVLLKKLAGMAHEALL